MTTAVQSTEEVSLQIEGMTCGSCVSHVDKALRSVPGVTAAAVNLATNSATVWGSAEGAALVAAVEHAGYKATVVEDLSAKTLREIEARGRTEEGAVRRRLVLGFLFGAPAVAVEMMLHHGGFWGRHLGMAVDPGYNILAAILATVVVATTGLPFFTRGVKAARHGNPTMDTLVALGAGTAYVASAISLGMWLWRRQFERVGEFSQPAISEFHAAVVIIVLVTLGKYLEARAKRRASSGVASLASQSSPTAVRIRGDGTLETIAAEQVRRGDVLQVLAHQQLPVDGVVMEGAGLVNLSIITGESVPVEVSAAALAPLPPKTAAAPAKKSLSLKVLSMDAPVQAPVDAAEKILPGGATLVNGRIALRATSTAAGSTVARILQLVNSAQAGKLQIQGLADRVAAVFVPVVLVAAAANFAVHLLLHGGWQAALLTSIATLIIACPCAMGLATPAAITVAIGRAAKLGILFTNPRALETARGITTVIFDKTGTLTTGRPHLVETVGVGDKGAAGAAPRLTAHAELSAAGQHALQIAAGLEQYSEHPLAQALVEAAKKFSPALAMPRDFSSVPGGGVTGTVAGKKYAVGSPAFARSMQVDLSPVAADIERLRDEGKTLSVLVEMAGDGAAAGGGPSRVAGLFAFQDTLRADAGETVHLLRERGFKVGVLSGDTEAAVRGAIQGMAVDFLKSSVQPAEKAAEVKALRAEAEQRNSKRGGATAFIGDGVNDAPALASADLGIAMASATQIAKTSGDVLLMSNRLATIPALFALSEKTLRVIKQNLFWAFAYNVVAIPLAMLGILPPAAAAAAMILSSLTVVVNALRLRRLALA